MMNVDSEEPPVLTTETSSSPIVFQCNSCSTIVGDSFSWVCSHRQLNSITIAVATKGVTVSDELVTSKEGVDLGSTTTAISCSKCQSVLGQIYKTTPRWLDGIRDMYTFNADRITTYELGSEELTNLAAKNDNLFTASADSILSRMGKLELLCLSLYERVGELEKGAQGNSNGAYRGRGRGRGSSPSQ